MQPPAFEVPDPRRLARHAVPRLLEGVLAPLALFYLALYMLGIWGALGAGLLWSYTAIGVRVVTRRRVPGVLLLGAAGMTARTVLAAATGSVFVYFLQPTLGTAAVAGAFLLSVPAGRPLAHRLAGDFCPLPAAFANHPRILQFFRRISLLWGLVYLINAGVTTWLLLRVNVATYVVVTKLLSWSLTGSAIVVSALWFRRWTRRHELPVVWPRRRRALVAPTAAGAAA